MAKPRSARPSAPPPGRRTFRQLGQIFVALLCASIGWWAFAPSLDGVFVHDDIPAIVDNPNIRSLWPLASAMSAPKDVTLSGRPVASLSFAVNYALTGDRGRDETGLRRGYHTVNVLIHLAAGLALFGVIRRTLLTGPLSDTFGNHATAIAGAAALIWLIHPLQTSSVTYIVQRVESLTGLFYLVTLYCAIRAADAAASARAWSVVAVLCCALGMATKEVMVSAPLIVALWLWIFGDTRAMRSHAGLLGALGATWSILAILVLSQPRTESVGLFIGGWTPWTYLVTQAAVVVHYLRLCVVPAPLVFSYDWRPEALGATWPQVLLMTTLAAATVLAIVRKQPIGFLGAWWFLILAPTSSVLPIATEVAAEHRLYLPLAAVATSAVVLCERLIARLPLAKPGRAAIGLIAAAVVVLTLGVGTRARNADYRSTVTLWRDTVEKRPGHSQAHVLLGAEYLRLGRYADAEKQLRQAIALPPPFGAPPRWMSVVYLYLGSSLCAQGQTTDGIRHLDTAIQMNPDLTEVYGLKAAALADAGQDVAAALAFRDALRVLPGQPDVLERAAAFFRSTSNPTIRDTALAARLEAEAARIRSR